jgi:hypothetical protein
MNTSSPRPLLLAVLAASGLALNASAANIISLDYGPANSGMTPDEVAGAPGVRTGNWNSAPITAAGITVDLPAGTLVDNSGNILNNLSMSLYVGNGGNGSTRGAPTGGVAPALVNDGRMFRTVTDKFDGAEGTITINGIPYAKYLLYFYVYPDSSAAGERGGYFSVTNSTGAFQIRWIKGGTGANTTVPLPDPNTGDGYVESKTSIQPTNFAGIDAGHFVVISGIDEPNIVVHYNAIGGGAGGVTGGDTVRRLKLSGFQIVEVTTAKLTGLQLSSPIPSLYSGNPQGTTVPLLGVYQDGSTAPLVTPAGLTFTSSKTNIFTVTTNGVVKPGSPGTANLIVSYQGLSLTQAVEVLAPLALRPMMTTDLILRGATLQAVLMADFADGKTDVNVTTFAGVVFSSTSSTVVSVTPSGVVSAIGVGDFNLRATYAGVTGQNDTAGSVQPYDPPQPDQGVAVSFNIQAGNAMLFNDLSGATGVRVGYWNNIAGLGTTMNTVTLGSGAIKDSAGKLVSSLNVSVTGGTTTSASAVRGTQSGNESTMFNGIFDQFSGTPGTIAITNIPFAVYDLYLYAYSGDAANRPGHFTIDDQTRWIIDTTDIKIPDNDGNGYLEAINTNAPTSIADLQPGNYVKFPGLKSSSLSVQFVADSGTVIAGGDTSAPRLKFSGFQLVGTLAPLAPPSLKVSWANASSLRISWPLSAANYTLKSNTVLNRTWNPVNLTPTSDGQNWSVTIPISGTGAFYILQAP